MADEFQFTPLREGRPEGRACCRCTTNFNSRPSARGDTSPADASTAQSFQFTPLREGRRSGVAADVQERGISIHAPPRGATPSQRRLRLSSTNFNSRPSARGDARACAFAPPHNLISIHAPPRGATRILQRSTLSNFYFNSRPSARGDGDQWGNWVRKIKFQFTPLREGRRRRKPQ